MPSVTAMRDGPKPTNPAARSRPLTVPTPSRSSASTWFRRLRLRVSATAALGCRAGADMKPATAFARILATNCGSLDSLNGRTRCGCRPWARQMRWTELTLIPTALAMAGARPMGGVRWRSSQGQGQNALGHRGRQGWDARQARLVAPRPATPSAANRSCQRQRGFSQSELGNVLPMHTQQSLVSNSNGHAY